MARAIDLDKAIEIIEEKQKELCPVGNYGRHYVYDSDREKYDAWEEIIDALNALSTLTPPNEPLTIEQLREMDGEPAWWDDGEGSCWGIISVATNGRWAGIPFFRGRWKQANFEYDIKSRGMTLYRRPPEGEADA